MESPRITEHAIQRYITRVDGSASKEEARSRVEWIITRGRIRSTPRHWMRSSSRTTPGLRYVYCWQQPDVCALVLDGAVVTVLTHELCRPLRLTVAHETSTGGGGHAVYELEAYRQRRRPDYGEAA